MVILKSQSVGWLIKVGDIKEKISLCFLILISYTKTTFVTNIICNQRRKG